MGPELTSSRTRKLSQITLLHKPNMPELCSSGLTAIERVRILVQRCGNQPTRAMAPLKSRGHSLVTQRERKQEPFGPLSSLFVLIILSYSRHVIRAALNPINLDDRQVNAVSARIEIDLRLGAAFTRFQSLTLRKLGGDLENLTISYGQLFLQFVPCSHSSMLTLCRIMSISHPWFCC